MINLLLIICAIAVVVAGVAFVLDFFSSERRSLRASGKAGNKELLTARRQLKVARDSLIKIAANDSGNPSLEANIALEDMSKIELKELES